MDNEERLAHLEEKLGYRFRDRSLLVQALSHASYVNEAASPATASNERMEFLGDSVLGLVITRYLYDHYPDCPEGEMTLMRSVLVSEGALARVARRLDLGRCLYLGKGEAASGGRDRRSNLSNAVEALLAAVYLDGGLDEAARVTRAVFSEELERVEHRSYRPNYKNLLQNHSQEKGGVVPTYVLVSSSGPQHDRRFEMEVRIGDRPLGRGTGRSKKEAEQEAARAALNSLGIA